MFDTCLTWLRIWWMAQSQTWVRPLQESSNCQAQTYWCEIICFANSKKSLWAVVSSRRVQWTWRAHTEGSFISSFLWTVKQLYLVFTASWLGRQAKCLHEADVKMMQCNSREGDGGGQVERQPGGYQLQCQEQTSWACHLALATFVFRLGHSQLSKYRS